MPGLGDLPAEMVLEILQHVPRRGQAAFTRAVKWTNAITDPYMYQQNKEHGNSSAIGKAVDKGNISALQKAIFYGLDPNRREPARGAPLHRAVTLRPFFAPQPGQEATREIIRVLLKAGADQRLKDDEYRTPFEVACSYENYGAALVLLDSEYSKVVLNQRAVNRTLHQVVEPLGEYTPFTIRKLCIALRVEEYKSKFPVYWANQREVLRRILSMPRVNVNSRRYHVYRPRAEGYVKLTPLLAALAPCNANGRGRVMPDIGTVEMLLEAGARPNVTSPNKPHNNALNMAVNNLAVGGCWCLADPATEEVVDFVKLLISYGVRLDAGGKKECPFRRALVLENSTDSVNIDERDKERLKDVVKVMVKAKRNGP